MIREDIAILNVVKFKLATDGLLSPNRDDIRDVGTIRAKYGFSRQRDDEGYTDYLDRITAALVKKNEEG